MEEQKERGMKARPMEGGDMIEKLKETRDLFESIICLCVEGREVVARKHLLDAIQKEAEKGYEIGR